MMFRWLHGRENSRSGRSAAITSSSTSDEHPKRHVTNLSNPTTTDNARDTDSGELRRVHYVFRGEVQGVGFRWNAQRCANNLELSGWVRNEWDGSVTMEIQGSSEGIALFFAHFNKYYSRYHITYVIDEKQDIPLRDNESGFRVLYT